MKKLLVLASVMQMSLLVAGEVNIKGLDKGALFKALYANAGGDADDLNDAGIQKASNGFVYFINGRLMRTDVSKNWFDTWLYNGEYGVNAAENVIAELRKPNQ